MASDKRRARRVEDGVRTALCTALQTRLGDPTLSRLVITGVSVTDDLGLATINVRLLSGTGSEDERRSVLRRLERASGRLRQALAPALGLRRVPELRFYYDTGLEAATRVEELLMEIATEKKPK